MLFYVSVLRHSLRGVWVEIISYVVYSDLYFVTPFGECGLKFVFPALFLDSHPVTPFGECGLKCNYLIAPCCTGLVTPFGECGLKSFDKMKKAGYVGSLPSGSVG